MLFTLFVAALAALAWALFSALPNADGALEHHDPSTLELAAMAAITVTAFVWMKRLKAIRERAHAEMAAAVPQPVPDRYAEAKVEAAQEIAPAPIAVSLDVAVLGTNEQVA